MATSTERPITINEAIMTQVKDITIIIENQEFEANVEFTREAPEEAVLNLAHEDCCEGSGETFEIYKLVIITENEFGNHENDISFLIESLQAELVARIKECEE